MKKIILGVFVALCAGCVQPQEEGFRFTFRSSAELREFLRYDTGFPPYVHAHRGGGYAGYPENCLETFEYTLARVPAFMEIDPRVTKDSVIVLMHDATLDRTTNVGGRLHDLTFEELQRSVRLKDHLGNATGYRVPTFAEALRWAKGRTVLIIDKKDAPLDTVLAEIKKEGAQANVIVMAYNPDDAARIYASDPELMMQVFVKDQASLARLTDLGIPIANMVSFVGHVYPKEGEAVFDFLHEHNIKGIVGSSRNIDKEAHPGNLDGYRRLLEAKADIIEADSALCAGRELLRHWKDEPVTKKYLSVKK